MNVAELIKEMRRVDAERQSLPATTCRTYFAELDMEEGELLWKNKAMILQVLEDSIRSESKE